MDRTNLHEILRQLNPPVETLETLLEAGEDSVVYFSRHGSEAFTTWEVLYKHAAKTGFRPFLIGKQLTPYDTLALLKDRTDSPFFYSIDQTLEVSELIDPAKWLNILLRDALPTIPDERAALAGSMVNHPHPFGKLINIYDHTGLYLPVVYVALVPTDADWKVPAYLHFGDFNDCHAPEFHCAVLKMWCAQYDAHLVTVQHDSLEFIVRNPPTTSEVAFQLAKDHFAYCPDIVYQGVGTIGALAQGLWNGTTWYFWWD